MSERTSTYLDFARSAEQPGGRFTKQTASKVIGVPTYPKLPDNSPWANNPVPTEPPLGIDVNDLERRR